MISNLALLVDGMLKYIQSVLITYNTHTLAQLLVSQLGAGSFLSGQTYSTIK